MIDFAYISQGVAGGIALGVFLVVFGWVGHVVFFGIRSVELGSSRTVWGDD